MEKVVNTAGEVGEFINGYKDQVGDLLKKDQQYYKDQARYGIQSATGINNNELLAANDFVLKNIGINFGSEINDVFNTVSDFTNPMNKTLQE